MRVATELAERTRLWQGRKKAFGAMGRISPQLVVQDAVVPRTKLPAVLARIREIGEAHGVLVCNVFHAGDGNLHPNIPYDAADADQAHRVEGAGGPGQQRTPARPISAADAKPTGVGAETDEEVIAAADEHGLAPQGWVVEHLDGGEERVHVDVEDEPLRRHGWIVSARIGRGHET